MNKAFFNWSGGKDSALALYYFKLENTFRLDHLLTTVNGKYGRVSMHGVREELLDQQATSIGLDLIKVRLPEFSPMAEYESVLSNAMVPLKEKGIDTAVYGDIFLEDLRQYREQQLEKFGMQAIFPLWKRPTKEVAQDFIQKGFKTIVVCVDEKYLDQSFAGRIYDKSFLNDLPENVDPCGENGEFHSFVFDGPIFKHPIEFEKGDITYRSYKSENDEEFNTGFWFFDLKLRNGK